MPVKKKRSKSILPAKESGSSSPTTTRKKKRANERVVKWRIPIVFAIATFITCVVLFASWVRLFNVYFHFQDYVNEQLLSHLDTQVEKTFDTKEISLIFVDATYRKDEQPSGEANIDHRQYHAKLIDALTDAGAKAIAFDMWFNKDSVHDAELARAIARAEASGTTVLIGLNPDVAENQYIPLALRSIPKDCWSNIAGGSPGNTKIISMVRLADESSQGATGEATERAVVPGLALKAVEALKYRNLRVRYFFSPMQSQIRIRDSQGEVLQSIPVNRRFYFPVNMVGAHEEGEIYSYHELFRQIQQNNRDYLGKFRDKIVLVGYQANDVVVTPDGNRFGSEVIANSISNVLLQNYVQPLGFIPHSFLVLLMVAIGAVLPLKFDKWTTYKLPVKLPVVDKLPVPIVLLAITILYVFIAVLFYMFERTVFDVSYQVAALFLAYLSTSVVRNKLGFA